VSKQRSQPPDPAASSQAQEPLGPSLDLPLDLSLDDTVPRARRLPAAARPASPAGRNPYDVSPREVAIAARTAELKLRPKPTDLRKLSEWIRLQRQVETLKKTDPESEPGSD
jgi:hypothetical protein